MDDELGLMPDTDRKAAKQGRRAPQPVAKSVQSSRQSGEFDGSLLEKSQERRNKKNVGDDGKKTLAASILDDNDDVGANEEKPKRGGKPKSTWDFDPNGGKSEDAYDDERLMAKGTKKAGSENESDADDIPMIPELEDTKDAVGAGTDGDGGVVSFSPGVVTKVATYRELEDDLMKHLPFLTMDQEVDLKPLTKFLIPEAFTQEPDAPWEWDALYAEVASELMKEIENLQSLNIEQDQQNFGNSSL